MADEDDLDAFFDDVEKVADEAGAEEDDESPPTKKQKTSPPGPPIRPVGVVVAAASSALKKSQPTPSQSETPKNEDQAVAAQSFPGSNVADSAAIGPAFPPPSYPPPQHQVPVGPEVGPAMPPTSDSSNPKQGHIRTAGGKTWVDTSLDEWPDDDFRIFVGNLGNDVTDAMLYQHFEKYASLQRATIVRDAKKTQQAQQDHRQSDSKGYGFVSFANALDCAKAIREMDQTWIGSRPIRIKRSTWKDRELKQVRKKEKFQKKHQKKRGLL